MITCREACELHTAAEEGALRGTKKLRYEVHMKVCGPCKRFRQQLRTTVEALKGLPAEKPAEDLVDLLAKEIDAKP